jgi:hypothetical protein
MVANNSNMEKLYLPIARQMIIMIKDKITLEIKDKIRDAISRTIKTGREYAFLICKNDKEYLFPRTMCEGSDCMVTIEHPDSCLPFRTQGNFHTHADVAVATRIFKDEEELPRKMILDIIKEVADSERVDITTPSQGDLINALVNKCLRRTEGTVCIASDAVPDRADCYTVNNKITENDCNRAKLSKFLRRIEDTGTPRSWIKPLFDKEIIDLNY